MSIANINAGIPALPHAGISSLLKHRKQDLKTIEDAVQSGDIMGA
jgi:hypothetical protein